MTSIDDAIPTLHEWDSTDRERMLLFYERMYERDRLDPDVHHLQVDDFKELDFGAK